MSRKPRLSVSPTEYLRDNQGHAKTTEPSAIVFPRSLDLSNNGLLVEALRFYNSQTSYIYKFNWTELFQRDLPTELNKQRNEQHDALFSTLNSLHSSYALLRSVLNKSHHADLPRSNHINGNAKVPRIVMNVISNPEWRNDKARNLPPCLDKIHHHLDMIRSSVDLKAIRESIEFSYLHRISNNKPFAKILHLAESPADLVAAGFADYGLAEQLTLQFSASLYKASHRSIYQHLPDNRIPLVPGAMGLAGFDLHIQVRKQVKQLEQDILALGIYKSAPTLTNWFKGIQLSLDTLEQHFDHVLRYESNDDRRKRELAFPAEYLSPRSIAAQTGLYWALVLTSVLRVFFADLLTQIVTTSLPVLKLYDSTTSYAAIGLWELVQAKQFEHHQYVSYLGKETGDAPNSQLAQYTTDSNTQTADSKLQRTTSNRYLNGLLKQPSQFFEYWQLSAKQSDKMNAAGEQQILTGICQQLQKFQQSPLILPFASDAIRKKDPRKLPPYSPKLSMSYSEFYLSRPRYPILKVPNARYDRSGDRSLYQGSRVIAQAHLYVASYLIGIAVDDLGLSIPASDTVDCERLGYKVVKERCDRKDEEAETLTSTIPNDLEIWLTELENRPLPNTLRVIAGSYLWGGRKPPHKTHRDGLTFDLRFGPDTLDWPVSKNSKDISELVKKHWPDYLETLPQFAPIKVCGNKSKPKEGYKRFSQLLCVTQDRKNSDVTTGEQQHIFSRLWYEVRKQAFCDIIKIVRHSPSSLYKNETDMFDKIESDFLGTPHYISQRASQLNLVGHAALILSGASQIIFASQLTHFKAMRGIREGLLDTSEDILDIHAPAPFETELAGVDKVLAKVLTEAVPVQVLNHHHHWHAQYNHNDYKLSDEDYRISAAALDSRFRSYFPLWLYLGVDMNPFCDMLNAELSILRGHSEQWALAIIEEAEVVYSACLDYTTAYKSLYLSEPFRPPVKTPEPTATPEDGPVRPPAPEVVNKGENLLAARRNLHRVWNRFSPAHPSFIQPYGDSKTKISKRVQTAIDTTQSIINKAKEIEDASTLKLPQEMRRPQPRLVPDLRRPSIIDTLENGEPQTIEEMIANDEFDNSEEEITE